MAKQRAGGGGGGPQRGNDEQEQTLNQTLTEMDGFQGNTGIVVIGATNRADTLDAAVLRPGRFDRRVPVDLPDRTGRLAILKVRRLAERGGREWKEWEEWEGAVGGRRGG